MAPKTRGATAAPQPTAASTKPTRKTSPAALPSTITPPAAETPPLQPKPRPQAKPRAKGKGKAPPITLPAEAENRPLFSNPSLEDHVRTRVADLEYMLNFFENFRASQEMHDVLRPALGTLQASINSFKKLTPEVGPGFGEPDGNPDSSLAGSPPPLTIKPRRRTARAPAKKKKTTTKGPEGGVTKPTGGSKAAARK